METQIRKVGKMKKNRKAQSTLEYVIIWTAIVAAILIAAKSALQPAVTTAVGTASAKITTEVGRLTTGLGMW